MLTRYAYLTAIICGAAATLSGVAIARFAYTALLPAIIQQGWFNEKAAAFLSAINLLGYALGAVLASSMVNRWGAAVCIRVAAALVFLSTICVAWPAPVELYSFWRFLCGAAGGLLMASAPPVMLASVEPSQRRWAGACIFTGIGIGIFLSALMTLLIKDVSLNYAWLSVGGLALISYLLLQFLWSGKNHTQNSKRESKYLDADKPEVHNTNDIQTLGSSTVVTKLLALLLFVYALDAVGYIPHTVFWVDYLDRDAGFSFEFSSIQWALFGIGAATGPFIVGAAAQKFGWQTALFMAFSFKGAAVLLPVISLSPVSISISSYIVGAMVPGLVAAMSGRLSEVSDGNNQVKIWGLATAIFACTQGVAAYFFAFLYVQENGAFWSFTLGSAALLFGAFLLLIQQFLTLWRVRI